MSATRVLGCVAVVLAGCSASGPAQQCPQQSTDIALFQRIQTGTLEAHQGFLQISQSDGWPIRGCTGYLVAVLGVDSQAQPYSVESLEGSAFPKTAMSYEASGVAWALVPMQYPEGATYQVKNYFGDPVDDPYSRVFLRTDAGVEVPVVRPRAGTAHFERWPKLADATGQVPAREVKVWVPPQTPTRVLYVNDGQQAFAPAVDLPSLAGPSTLVVGIDADPAARLQEYEPAQDVGPDGGAVGQRAEAYLDYVNAVVRPLIEAHYGAPAKSGVLGCGAGGASALKLPLRFTNRWDLVAGLSADYGAGHWHAANPTLAQQWATARQCPVGAVHLAASGPAPDGGCVDLDGDGLLDDPPGDETGVCSTQQLAATLTQQASCGAKLTTATGASPSTCPASFRALGPKVFELLEQE